MSPVLYHTLILLAVTGLSFMLPLSRLSDYDLQIFAILFIALFIIKRVTLPNSLIWRLIESVVFTFGILFMVNTTGGVSSPYFFLLYFLVFSLSLLLEPVLSMTVTLGLILFFVLKLPAGQSVQSLIPVISLAFLAPFAMLLGQEYVEIQASKYKIQSLEDSLEHSKEETFLFLSLNLKKYLERVERRVENFNDDKELPKIKKDITRIRTLIDSFEKTSETE